MNSNQSLKKANCKIASRVKVLLLDFLVILIQVKIKKYQYNYVKSNLKQLCAIKINYSNKINLNYKRKMNKKDLILIQTKKIMSFKRIFS